MNRNTFSCVGILIGIFHTALLFSGNLFFNPGVEMGISGYVLHRFLDPKTNPGMMFPPLTADPEHPFQGKYSLRIENPFGEFFSLHTKRILLPANTKVSIGCAMRGTKGVKKVLLRAISINEDGQWSMHSKVFPVTPEWKRYGFDFDTRKTSGEWQIQICQAAPGTTTGTLWIDNILFEKKGDISSVPPISIAVLPEKNVLILSPGEKKDLSAVVYLSNDSGKHLSGTILLDMTDEHTGKILQTRSLSYDLPPEGVLKTNLKFDFSRYGAFRLAPRINGSPISHLDGFVCSAGKNEHGEIDPWQDFCMAVVNAQDMSIYNGVPCRVGIGDVPEKKYDLLEQMGCRLIRNLVYPVTDWRILEPQEGKFNFTELDYAIDTAAKHHITLMPCFGNLLQHTGREDTRPYPPWLAEKTTLIKGTIPRYTVRIPPEDLFERYVRAFVKHAGKRIRLYECMNEPNLYLSPELYSRYLAIAYRGMKAENPDAMMIGICVTGDMGGMVEGYLKGCVKAGALENLDAVSFHPYNARTLSSVTPADAQISEIRKIIKGKPLFNSELFYLYDRDDQKRSLAAQSNASPANLAQRTLTDLGEGVRQSMNIYENQLWTQRLSTMYNPTWIDEQIPNSLFVTLNALFRHFESAKTLKKYKNSNGLMIYLFERKGKPLAALWQYRPTGKMKIDLTGMKLYDVFGNPISDGCVPITADPIYCYPGSLTEKAFREKLANPKINFEQPAFSPVARKIGNQLFFRIGNLSNSKEKIMVGLTGGRFRAQKASGFMLDPREYRNESITLLPGSPEKPLFYFFKFGERIGQTPCNAVDTAILKNREWVTKTSENKAFSAKGRVTLANGNVICEFQVKDLTPDGANAGRQTWQCDGIELFFDRAPEQIQLPHPEVYTQEVFRMFINPYDKKKLTLEHCKGIGLTEKDCSLKVNIENDGYRIRLEFPLKYGKWLGFTWKANNAGKKMQTLAWGTPGRDDFFKNRLAFGCVSSD